MVGIIFQRFVNLQERIILQHLITHWSYFYIALMKLPYALHDPDAPALKRSKFRIDIIQHKSLTRFLDS